MVTTTKNCALKTNNFVIPFKLCVAQRLNWQQNQFQVIHFVVTILKKAFKVMITLMFNKIVRLLGLLVGHLHLGKSEVKMRFASSC